MHFCMGTPGRANDCALGLWSGAPQPPQQPWGCPSSAGWGSCCFVSFRSAALCPQMWWLRAAIPSRAGEGGEHRAALMGVQALCR